MIYSIYFLIYSTKFSQKTISFGFQHSLVSHNDSLGVIQRFNFTDGRFCQGFEIVSLFNNLLLLKMIGELFLSLVELCTVALDEGCRG